MPLDRVTCTRKIRQFTSRRVRRGVDMHDVAEAIRTARHMLVQYNLSLSGDDVAHDTLFTSRIFTGYRQHTALSTIVGPLAELTDTLPWYGKNPNEYIVYKFWGFRPDAFMAGHLYSLIHRAYHNEIDFFSEEPEYVNSPDKRAMLRDYQGLLAREIHATISKEIDNKTKQEDEAKQGVPNPVLNMKFDRVIGTMKTKHGFVPDAIMRNIKMVTINNAAAVV